ncbi:S8 family serine peptidase [Archangium violaceum]|uniref:S8 family serine peptidase n=1 Tax=Archangium violaceum TaxID=83451 RepID=UPI001951D257|nr:S8 family serine peptidase [Archangium violaceum]QRN99339.1 S8 family serine peptidase [Archangium violaceum]
MSRISALLLGLCFVLTSAARAAPPPLPKPGGARLDFVPGQVIVKFKTQAAATALKSGRAALANARLESLQGLPFGMDVLRFAPTTKGSLVDDSAATWEVIAQLRSRPDVEFAHPNYRFQFSAVPNDPLYPRQWHYPLIQLPRAWDLTTGTAGIRIALLDSGRTNHPDLAGRWVQGLEFDAADQDGNAQDDGYIPAGSWSRVFWRHGTHVAGIVAGASNNQQGSAGVCWGCQVLPVKVSGRESITLDSLVRGINWAVANGARVINMSLELGTACTVQEMAGLRTAVSVAIANNVTVVVAAGNQAVDAANTSPASCPGVIAVAATTRTNALAPYSNFGAVTLAAPGGGGTHDPRGPMDGYGTGIDCPEDPPSFFSTSVEGAVSAWTTSPTSNDASCYRYLSGTSMAAPHVSGVVGLMLSVNPNLRPADITQLLRTTAQPLAGCGGRCGAGLVNAFAAVQAAREQAGPCGWAPAGQACTFDSLSHYVNSAGVFEETVVAYGRMWKFNLAGQRIGSPVDLRSIPRYANGPCAWAPAGQPCRFETSTTLDYPGIGYVESVGAYGRYWNFDAWGNVWAGSGSDLRSVSRYAQGPCRLTAGTSCRMDTRNLVDYPGWGLIESINGYGRYWIFNAAGTQLEEGDLRAVPRYANGPCAWAPAGQACVFDTRELAVVPGQGLVETITAYGRYWEFDAANNPRPGSGALLSSIPRFR